MQQHFCSSASVVSTQPPSGKHGGGDGDFRLKAALARRRRRGL
ncbi:MAG: hypothetical protein ACI30W_03360 [Muribaculaceae bacterium]